LYLALAATWIPLAYLVITTGTRGGTAGIGAGMAWPAYALTQFQAIPHYLRLCFWPQPLVFDYGTGLAGDVGDVLPGALIVTVLLIGTAVALRRWPSVGFLGAWFFAILAPTSSVVPVASQTIAEHRLYLPLAAVIAAAVLGAFALGKRLLNHQQGVALASMAGATVVILFSWLTIQRNRDYHSSFSIWQDTVDKCPDNPRAHDNLGIALREQGRLPEAIDQYEQALRLRPDDAQTRYNLGIALLPLGRTQEAIELWEQALQIKPDLAEAHYNLGNAMFQTGKVPEAIHHYEQALLIKPDLAEAHYNLAVVLEQAGQLQQAIEHYQQALRITPDYLKARNALARIQGR
jgi:tetratricopeptide (TPR) repeat protein